jgi:two-component system cell cycle sensor histidine kinase/response regulator CckA
MHLPEIGNQTDRRFQKMKAAELRHRAEQLFDGPDYAVEGLSVRDRELKEILHELQVHQIELEMQNEELLQTQLDLHRTKAEYADLYNCAPMGYLIVDSRNNITRCNLTFAAMMGFTVEDLLQRHFFMLIVEESRNKLDQLFQWAREGKTPWPACEVQMVRPDMSSVWMKIEGTTLTNGNIRLAVFDISQLKDVEEDLRQARDRWENTFDSVSDVIAFLDIDLKITLMNRAGCELFNIFPEEAIGSHCYELFCNETSPCVPCPVRENLITFKGVTRELYHESLKKYFLASAYAVKDRGGGGDEVVYILKDITDKILTDKRLHQAKKMECIGRLAGGIAHDFNNILAIIAGSAELAQWDITNQDEISQSLHEILRASHRAKKLVEQILTFSQHKKSQKQQILLTPIIKETLKMIRPMIPSTILIEEKYSKESGTTLVDPTKIYQIILNLCTNAFQAMDNQQGSISIKLETKKIAKSNAKKLTAGMYNHLAIADTGKGIHPDALDKVFEPFFTTKEVGQGTGLGLATTYGIVKDCGGIIDINSTPGQGTTFHIYLPVQQDKIFTESSAPVPFSSLAKGKGTVLLIDDEPDLLRLTKRMLKGLGYSPIAISSGEEALNIFKKNPDSFYAIITDQTMPDLPGNLLAKKMLEIRPDVPIILWTGHSSIVSEKEALRMGIQKYLMKPASMLSFAEALIEFAEPSE